MEACSSVQQTIIPGQSENVLTHCACGYSTPPRTSLIEARRSPLSFRTRILTSAELKQRFSPIKKRRRHLVELQVNERTDSFVPLKRPRHMPVLLPKLFADEQKDAFSMCPKQVYPHLIFDQLRGNSFKNPDEKSFTISENILKEKFQTLVEKPLS